MSLVFNQADTLKPLPRPLERSPCANVEPLNQWGCPNNGTSACSKCLIVGYCSKDCQKKHWSTHKSDCKNPIRSEDWRPGWVVEGRSPTFISGNGPDKDWVKKLQKEEPIALGMHLWGNIPAMNLINLSMNENNATQDISLAMRAASGDLRNIVRTINELPSNFSGKISILLNDREPIIVVRNMILLLILGTVSDKEIATDLALHFWYSAMVPTEYDLQLQQILLGFVETLDRSEPDILSMSTSLGPNSTLSGKLGPRVTTALAQMTYIHYDIEDISKELQRVRFAPSRQDRHHRHYCRMEPSHRLSAQEFRRFGLVLPFGARNDHFNYPNQYLFSPEGKWLQDDLATPLDSWEIPAIIEAGKAHGARREDLYGCLYFYLSDQLRVFAERLRRFHIEIRMFNEDASDLSQMIRRGHLSKSGVLPSTKFDRIEVSNIIDAEYVGIPGVLETWGPFLKETKHATLIGSSMNWPMRQKGADASSVDENTTSLLTKRLLKKVNSLQLSPSSTPQDINRISGLMMGHLHTLTALYDNSANFNEYLAKHGLHEALRKGNLKLKEHHTIVPHRIGARLGASSNALPDFTNKESWYLNTGVGLWLWSERFIEISRA